MKKLVIVCVMILLFPLTTHSKVRVKDICYFSGLESKQLIGHGLVIGLNGTGDGGSSQMTTQAIKNMMERFGLTVPIKKIRPNNVATVIVTATMPYYSKIGGKFDITVSSVGTAKSLEGGILLMTNLIGNDGLQYGVAQGPVSIGGFNAAVKGAKIRKNFTTVGRIPNGGAVSKEVFNQILYNGELLLNLQNSDFSTAYKIAKAINDSLNMEIATPQDAKSIEIIVPESMLDDKLVELVSRIENINVVPDQKAIIVINERTGTIVSGGRVQISQVAVSHGNLTIKIETRKTEDGAEETAGEIKEESAQVMMVEAATVQDLARALNSIKVTPRDLISIFQSLKVAGALQAELVIM